MNEITEYGDRRMTTDEVCRVLGCDRTTLMRNWREIETCAAPAKDAGIGGVSLFYRRRNDV